MFIHSYTVNYREIGEREERLLAEIACTTERLD